MDAQVAAGRDAIRDAVKMPGNQILVSVGTGIAYVWKEVDNDGFLGIIQEDKGHDAGHSAVRAADGQRDNGDPGIPA
jgi:hypothetical protein